MQPTTISFCDSAKTSVCVYDTIDKKLVLIFESIFLCAKYLDIKYHTISNSIKSKKRIEKNIFSIPIALRVASREQKDLLLSGQYLILDIRFTNDEYIKSQLPVTPTFKLENILKVGDVVELKYGTFAGAISRITDIKDATSSGFGKKNFGFILNGEKKYFLSSVLNLFHQ